MPRQSSTNSGAGRRRWIPVFLPVLVVLAACAGGPAPVFEGRRGIGTELILFEPAVRLGGTEARLLADEAGRQLGRLLRQRLAGRGLAVDPLPLGDASDEARDRLVRVVLAEKMRGRRLRSGATLRVAGLADVATRRGASAVAVAVLTRSGVGPRDGEFLPLPEGQLVELPDARSEYEVPDASRRHRVGVDLDFVIVDAATDTVRLHRRVSYPLDKLAQLPDVLPVLVREATRGISP